MQGTILAMQQGWLVFDESVGRGGDEPGHDDGE
jgi:hypothetical protein